MAVLKNRAKMSTSATGTGSPITLGSAEDGYQTFADAGVANADVVRYVIEDGSNFEIGTGTYTSSGTTLSRTVSESSNSDAAINLSGSATVFIGATAEDIPALYAENYDGTSTLPSATGTNALALQDGAVASANRSIAIGRDAVSSGNYAVALGVYTDAVNSFGTALGYKAQTASSDYATALTNSRASGSNSFAAAIANNTSSYGASQTSTIAMGYQAKATTNYAIAIGSETQSRNWHGISIGYQNDNGTLDKALTLGWQNTTSGNRSVAIGDNNDCTTGDAYALGTRAKSSVRGKYAYASGQFAAVGDAQGGQFILRADTTDATATVLTTNNSAAGSDDQIVAASDTCITFDGTITAMQNGAQAYASWKIEGLLVNDGGTTTLANSATTVISNADGWGMALSADNTNNALAITCTGEASHNIRWVANIRTTEVTYA